MGAAGESGADIAVFPPVAQRGDKRGEPQEGTDEVDPNGILHALDAAVALGVFLDEELRVDKSVNALEL